MFEQHTLSATDPLTKYVGRNADVILRWIVGLALVPHGIAKLLNLAATADEFTNIFHLRPGMPWAIFIAAYQIIAGLMICFGVKVRWAALSIPVFMIGTMVIANAGHGWFWHLGGIEYSVIWSLLAIVVAARAKS